MSSNNGYFAVDIERSGHGDGDVTFAIGWACSDQQLANVTKSNVCLDMQLGCDEDVDHMRSVWLARGFEGRCFEEFWSKNLSILKTLQDSSKVNLVSAEYDMAQALNDALLEAETKFANVMIVSDTIMFDTIWCNILLTKYGFKGLSWTRAGKYRCGYELDSYTLGSLGFPPDVEWSEYVAAMKLHIDPIFADIVVNHDHNPENDAMSILVKFIRVVNYNLQKQAQVKSASL